MIPDSEIITLLSDDKKKLTTREILKNLVNNPEVSSILIGEKHNVSPTLDLILANLDILIKSRRKVVLIFEHLHQKENTALAKALEKNKKNIPNPLKNVAALQNEVIDFFIVVLAAITNNIEVVGAENDISNPFGHIKQSAITNELLRKMEKFQKSDERITKTNDAFSEVISQFCNSETLPIFIGGASHPIMLFQGGELFDPGIQGRIKNSKSIYLLHSSTQSIQEKAPYTNLDRKVHGTYDFKLVTNKEALYKDTFDSIPQLMDKIKCLTSILNHLIKGYLLFDGDASVELQGDIHAILAAFKESTKAEVKFITFDKFLDELIVKKSLQRETRSSFFSIRKSSDPIEFEDALTVAIFHDLAHIIKDEIVHKIKT